MPHTRPPRRSYNLGRRAETKAETRQRIVEATSELHGELGISGTSMRAIAQRAGVSIATVYKHFPNYEEAIRACGEMAMQAAPPPDERIFIGRTGRQARVSAFVEAFFRYYEQCPWFEGIRSEVPRFAQVAAFIEEFDRSQRQLALTAVGRKKDAPLLVALTQPPVCRVLLEEGMSAEAAADLITSMYLNRIESCDSRPTNRKKKEN